MDCLTDYILLEGVTATVTPNSGLYLNRELSLPIENIQGAINNEQATLAGIWKDVQTRGIKKFIIRVKLGMQELFQSCNKVDDQWICANKEYLAMPLVYFLGSETISELSHTNRINRYTTLDKGRALEMKSEFDSEFQVQLKAALEIINSKETEPKKEMGQIFTYVEVLP